MYPSLNWFAYAGRKQVFESVSFHDAYNFDTVGNWRYDKRHLLQEWETICALVYLDLTSIPKPCHTVFLECLNLRNATNLIEGFVF